ncbi:MAG TPA: DUF2723 domain-containing protein [Verrucomicrobiae bacterium]|jgi:tetratricopeptide (TPR) repeat protein
MSNEHQRNPLKSFSVRQLPWLLGAAMLLLYVITLNHWVTLLNIGQVASLSGWIWQPQVVNPVQFLVLLPFHLVPAGKIPFVLNFFSAVCAALALILLARSIAILPHDRTDMERQRERSDFSFLTGWISFFPPIIAVILIGTQLSFWEHATSFTGESLELLFFAVIIWQLLEYRLDEAPRRLFLTAFLCGLGLAENWAFVSFFPVFIAAIIWLKKLEFFNFQFIGRMVLYGVMGLLFIFLLPLITTFSGQFHASFWDLLHPSLSADWMVLQSVSDSGMWHNLALVSLSTLLPLLGMSIRWSSTFGDSSRTGRSLVNYLFYFVHGAFFTVCVWVMFDPAFSPHQVSLRSFPPYFAAPSLTLYYLSALGIGYYCGFFLLIFGREPIRSRRNNNRITPALPKLIMWLCPVIVGGTFAVAAISAGLLLYKNVPIVHAVNDDTLSKYAQFTTQNLPANGGILLCDAEGMSANQAGSPIRTFLIQAQLAREGRSKDYVVVDTQSLNWSPYHIYLHRQFPNRWPDLFKKKEAVGVNPLGILGMLNLLAKSNNICYLNPSFGYYFESFYEEPNGLNYPMQLLPTNNLIPPSLGKNQIADNNKFWADVTESVSPGIEKEVTPLDPDRPVNFLDVLLAHLHVVPEPNQNAIYAGRLYSRALNYWGVQLQRAGQLDLAATNFMAATNLNPDNITAGINLDFNQQLRAGKTPEIDLAKINSDQFGKARGWQQLISANGPFDEASFTMEDGLILATQNGFLRQAIVPFNRVRQLVPDYLEARLQLAQTYIFNRLPDPALEALHDPLTQPSRFGLNENNSTGLNILASAAHFQKNENARGLELLQKEMARHPDDEALLTASVQACMMHGLYTDVLPIIEHKLAKTPEDPKWIFAKGYAELLTSNYDASISALTHVLKIQTNDPTARFNRALAYLKSNQLDSAKADYRQLQTTYTNSFQIAYGLGEIAWLQHETNEAVSAYELYLANAPTNTAEFTNIITRLRQLKK